MKTPETSAQQDRFGSLAELRDAHNALLSRISEESLTSEDEEQIQEFLEKAAAAGTLFDSAADRRQAQGLLDYWVTTQYVQARESAKDQGSVPRLPRAQTRLARFDTATVGEATENADRLIQSFSAADQELARRVLLRLTELDAETEEVRTAPTARSSLEVLGDPNIVRTIIDGLIGAGAVKRMGGDPGSAAEQLSLANEALLRVWDWLKQWLEQRIRFRDTVNYWVHHARSEGALIRGVLLDEARTFHDLNDREREFVERSRNAEISQTQRLRKSRNRFRALFIVALLLLIAGIGLAWHASVKGAEAVAALAREKAARASEKEARDTAVQKADLYQEENQRYAALLEESRQIVGFYQKEYDTSTPDSPFQMSIEAFQQNLGAMAWVHSSQGGAERVPYDADFLGISVPLPELTRDLKDDAYDSGRPLGYFHYSLVFHRKRRTAIYTACNYDRTKAIRVRHGPDNFRFDSYIAKEYQHGAAAYVDNDFDRGHFVSRLDVLWDRPGSLTDEAVQSAVNTYANTTPQYEMFNRGLWARIEDWVRTKHNPKAERVTIFTGTVFRDDDYSYRYSKDGGWSNAPESRTAKVARSFWKIVVSCHAAGSREPTVDAFLADQYSSVDPTTPKDNPFDWNAFDASAYQIRVADIEELTGLDFGELAECEPWYATSRTTQMKP
ncbi:MAG: DNA/RNA non-specific endonuclease [Phycisphaerales bacterium]|nr:MAG: DNA/RNA non-specific endonuclease [Phycisphaerales bacterium]